MFSIGFPRSEVWNAWRDLERLQEQLDRIFEPFGGANLREYPAVNVWVNDDGAVLTAELPGVKKEDIDISVLNDTLTIRGKRAGLEEEEGAKVLRNERPAGEFTRSIGLPFRIDAEKVTAKLERGILRVELPRPEQEIPRKISVKVS
ncbi:MAG: Hsp20/alpha crystallin family protein [Candidatus Hydrogenedentota bacterium]|nr:MAG: Hsp20/alpha crystallin family protein [Candidatus Hydrogenedentota bacterium]